MPLKTLPQKRKFLKAKAICESYTLDCSCKCPCTFPHSYADSFLQKIVLCETNNIFYSVENLVWHKVNDIFSKYIKNKGEVTLDGLEILLMLAVNYM